MSTLLSLQGKGKGGVVPVNHEIMREHGNVGKVLPEML